jgi:hypothetical protein
MSAFAAEQTTRDEILVRAIADGHFTVPGIADECRRWSTCNHCGHRSTEMRFLSEQKDWEADHEIYGCDTAKWDVTVVDPDLPLYEWPDHTKWTFTRELLPLLTVHVHQPVNHEFTSLRAPAVVRQRAA